MSSNSPVNDLSVGRSVCPVHCGKTADRIRIPFGIIGRTCQGMRQVVEFGHRSTGRGTIGGAFVRAIVTNGDFTAYVMCDSVSTVGAAICGGAYRGPRHYCIRWGSTSCKGYGRFWRFLFPIFTMGNAIMSPTVRCFRFVCENLTFPFVKHIVGKLYSWAFGDIFGFKINTGV